MTRQKDRPRFATNAAPTGRHGVLRYRSRGALLSAGELRFYRALRDAVADRWLVMTKVRLADVIEATDGFHSAAGRKIGQRHADFVLATKRGLRVVAVVELDDKTHLAPEQQRRDAYLADALHAAGVTLVRFPVYRHYKPRRIRRAVFTALQNPPAGGPVQVSAAP